MTLQIGDKAPEFSMPVDKDKRITLSELREKFKFIVLYFYPKDDTPGCTIEAGQFNGLKNEFEKLDSVIIGVSKDNCASHEKFKKKYSLNFDLASDENSNVCEEYDVLEKGLLKKIGIKIKRTTFLINKAGDILYIWRKVQANGHAKEVYNKVQEEYNKIS